MEFPAGLNGGHYVRVVEGVWSAGEANDIVASLRTPKRHSKVKHCSVFDNVRMRCVVDYSHIIRQIHLPHCFESVNVYPAVEKDCKINHHNGMTK